MNEKDISVIIPTYNRLKKLKKCLKLIVYQLHNTDEVIVVNNRSTDTTTDFLKKFSYKYKNVKVLGEERPGPSYARNLAVNHAKGNVLIFLDDDSFVKEGFIKAVRSACGQRNKINSNAVYQGEITHIFDSQNLLSKIFYARLSAVWKLLYEDEVSWKTKKTVHHINACNFFMRREILSKLEYLFDEKEFPFVGEERELAERLELSGVNIIYCSSAKITHSKSTYSFYRFIERAYADGRSEGLLERKYKVPDWKIKLFNNDLKFHVKDIKNSDTWKEGAYFLRKEPILTRLKIYFYAVLHQALFNLAYFKAKFLDYHNISFPHT